MKTLKVFRSERPQLLVKNGKARLEPRQVVALLFKLCFESSFVVGVCEGVFLVSEAVNFALGLVELSVVGTQVFLDFGEVLAELGDLLGVFLRLCVQFALLLHSFECLFAVRNCGLALLNERVLFLLVVRELPLERTELFA